MITEEKVIEILKQCYDPELPVDLWNLGLIYNIQIQEAYDETKSDINIVMSLTTPGCTMGDQIAQDIRNKLEKLNTADKVKFADNMINSHQIVGEEIQIQKTAAVTELRSLTSSPEAILCNVATQTAGKSYIEHNKRVDVGLILFPMATKVGLIVGGPWLAVIISNLLFAITNPPEMMYLKYSTYVLLTTPKCRTNAC